MHAMAIVAVWYNTDKINGIKWHRLLFDWLIEWKFSWHLLNHWKSIDHRHFSRFLMLMQLTKTRAAKLGRRKCNAHILECTCVTCRLLYANKFFFYTFGIKSLRDILPTMQCNRCFFFSSSWFNLPYATPTCCDVLFSLRSSIELASFFMSHYYVFRSNFMEFWAVLLLVGI